MSYSFARQTQIRYLEIIFAILQELVLCKYLENTIMSYLKIRRGRGRENRE